MTELDNLNTVYANKRAQDEKDLNAEFAGLDIGRIKRFLSGEAQEYIKNKQSGKSKNALSMLDILLLTDPLYAQLYIEVTEKIEKIDVAIAQSLNKLDERLAIQKEALSNIMDNANTLPDGSRIYRGSDGAVYREDGSKLSNKESASIKWDENHSSWESYVAAREALKITQRQKQDIETYKDTVVEHAKTRVHNRENPPDRDELKQILEDIEVQMPGHVRLYIQDKDTLQNSELMSEFHKHMAGVEQQDEAAILDIPDFGNTDDTHTIVHKPL